MLASIISLRPRLAAAPSTAQEPEVLEHSDVDDSLFVPEEKVGLQHSREAMQEFAPRTINGFCTGRGPTTASRFADALAGFPMKYFATNNGQNLFWNHDNLPADQFLRGLTTATEDPEWAQHVRQGAGNWDVGTIRSIMHDIVKSEGFQPAPHLPPPFDSHEVFSRQIDTPQGKRNVLFCIPLDQPAYHIRTNDGPLTDAHVAYSQALADKIGDGMTAAGIKWQFNHYPPVNNKIINFYQPPGITKKSLLEYMLTKYPSVRAVITIGDNVNDDMLDPYTYQSSVPGHAPIPNYPLLGGTSHPNYQELIKHPRLIVRPPGDMGPGIRAHMEEISNGIMVSHTA